MEFHLLVGACGGQLLFQHSMSLCIKVASILVIFKIPSSPHSNYLGTSTLPVLNKQLCSCTFILQHFRSRIHSMLKVWKCGNERFSMKSRHKSQQKMTMLTANMRMTKGNAHYERRRKIKSRHKIGKREATNKNGKVRKKGIIEKNKLTSRKVIT